MQYRRTPRVAVAAVMSALEPRRLFAAVFPSAEEQYLVELINRARANPTAEASRHLVDLNEGLAPGTISTAAKQPLAINPYLTDAARQHSVFQITSDTLTHTGSGGSSPQQRMEAAGYVFTGSWTNGENVGWSGTTSAFSLNSTITQIHKNLFVDAGVVGRGHRINLMAPDFRELGAGITSGVFTSGGTDYNAAVVTQD